MLKQIVDGFSYNANLLWLPNRFFPNALAQMDVLRRAVNYRARWFVVPDDIDQPIAPYDTLFYQFQVASGSLFWGWSFASISATNAGSPTETSASDLLLQLVDNCTGQPLFEDYGNAGGLSSNGNAWCFPNLLTQPRLIIGPGTVEAKIANRTANTITCQWLLHFAEPCRIIDETQREKDVRRGA
jgi:hypothetical protein